MTSDHKKLFEVLHVVGDSSSSARELYTTCRNALLHFGDDDIGLSTMEFNDGIVLNSSDIGAWSSDHDTATPDPHHTATIRHPCIDLWVDIDFHRHALLSRICDLLNRLEK